MLDVAKEGRGDRVMRRRRDPMLRLLKEYRPGLRLQQKTSRITRRARSTWGTSQASQKLLRPLRLERLGQVRLLAEPRLLFNRGAQIRVVKVCDTAYV